MPSTIPSIIIHLSPLLLRLLENLLDDLLLLNQESTDDAVLDAVGAAGATVGALDGLLWAGNGRVLAWAKGRDLERSCQTKVQFFRSVDQRNSSIPLPSLGTNLHPVPSSKTPESIVGCTYTGELETTVTTFWCSSLLLDVKVTEFTTWGLNDADLVGLGVVSG